MFLQQSEPNVVFRTISIVLRQSDGSTPYTGTISGSEFQIRKANAALGNGAGTVTVFDAATGMFDIVFTAADWNTLGQLVVRIVKAGIQNYEERFQIVPWNPNDVSVLGLTGLGNLDAAVSSRAPLSTALSTAQWTNGRATLQDNLDATVSSRATSGSVAAVQADTDDLQTRIPTALDGSGNIKAGVQTVASGGLTAIAGAVLAAVVETGFDLGGTLRTLLRISAAQLSGVTAGTYKYRNMANTKDAITGVTSSDGRTSVTVDPT